MTGKNIQDCLKLMSRRFSSQLKLKCTASIEGLYWKSGEEVVEISRWPRGCLFCGAADAKARLIDVMIVTALIWTFT